MSESLKELPADPNDPEFSLVLGGPLYQIFQKLFLSGPVLELLKRRVLFLTMVSWVPLFILSAIESHTRQALKIPFLYDVEAHARFLIALPALIIAEVTVHMRLSPTVSHFVKRKIVVEKDMPAFNRAIESMLRLRNSATLEVFLLILVFTLGTYIWRQGHLGNGAETWFGRIDSSGEHLTPAGYWYAYVSAPIFQFLLLRWYLRIAIWLRLLWQISRLDLQLTPTHPDRAGGLGFLGLGTYAFGPILFAQGTLLSGMIATRVLYQGAALQSFQVDAVVLVLAVLLVILSPLLIFVPLLDRTKRKGVAEYGLLAQRYAHGFEQKWLQDAIPDDSELLGTGDIQSLADLGNSYNVVEDMRVIPFTWQDAARLAAATAAPLVPLALTVFSVEELLSRLIQIML
jgi:hypothetical protein